MANRVTVRDIAAKAGVHFTTVALALRNSPRLSAATRSRIHKLATKMGYAPDPMLSALNAYRQGRRRPIYQATLAWINNWPDRGFLRSNADFRDYHDGACARAGELGYAVEEFWMHGGDYTFSNLGRILKARNIRGLVFPPQPVPHTEIDFDLTDFSAVSLSYSLKCPALHVVTNHHFRSMLLMMSNLHRLGYRRVGFDVQPSWSEKVGHGWLGGVLVAQQLITTGMEILQVRLFDGKQDARVWIRENRPDVIVSHKLCYEQLRALKLRMPRDVGFANLSVPGGTTDVSGVSQNSLHIGRKAVDVLVDMLHRGERGVPHFPSHLLIDGVWVPGTTLRKKKPALVA